MKEREPQSHSQMQDGMTEQKLRDFFHAYRPQIDDNEEFMDKLTAQMERLRIGDETSGMAADTSHQQQTRIIPLFSRLLPWAASIAACVAILIGSIALLRNHPTGQADGIVNAELAKTNQQGILPKAEEHLQTLDETPAMAQVVNAEPKKEAKRHNRHATVSKEQNVASPNEMPTPEEIEDAIHGDQSQMMVERLREGLQIDAAAGMGDGNTSGIVVDPYQVFEDHTRGIRLRGEHLQQEIAMLMKNQ
ncbi:MAG: hypothetical protein K6G08_10060 [Prevotella sp.]|nr:hypothetical protein [Prevotella sp.]